MYARALLLLLLLPWSALAQTCTPPAEKTIVLQLPGRVGLPPGSQMRLEVPVILVPEQCPTTPPPPVDSLRGPKPRQGSVLRGEPPDPVEPTAPRPYKTGQRRTGRMGRWRRSGLKLSDDG